MDWPPPHRQKGRKYGYIDKQNNMVIPVKYEDANPFYKGYAVVARKRTSAGVPEKPTITIPVNISLSIKRVRRSTVHPMKRSATNKAEACSL